MNKTLKTVNISFLSLLLVCGSSACSNKSQTSNDTNTNEKVVASSDPLEGTFVNSYDYYSYSSLDFDFIIANITLEEGATLQQVTTNQDVNLADVQSYISKLEENGFYVGKKNVYFSLPTTQFTGNIFIPVPDSSKTLELTYNNVTVPLEKTDHKGEIKGLLMNSTKDTFTDDTTYEMNVSGMFEITGDEMYENDTQLVLPSSARVFSFKVTVTSLSDDSVEVSSASVSDASGWNANAEGSSISSMKYENMIGKTVSEKDEANLFFIVLDQEHRYNITTGTLTITLSGVETPIEIAYE